MKKVLFVPFFTLAIVSNNVWCAEQDRYKDIEALLKDNSYQYVQVPGLPANLPSSCDLEDKEFDIPHLIQRLKIQPSPSKIFFQNVNQENYSRINQLLMAFPGHTYNIYIKQDPIIDEENPIETAKKIAELPFVLHVKTLSFYYWRIGDTGVWNVGEMPNVKTNLPEVRIENDYATFYKKESKKE
jgi:hypothetical protein